MASRAVFDRRSARFVLGLLAFMLTLAAASYQRRTGPSYPVPIEEQLGGSTITGKLPRSHPGEGGAEIRLAVSGDVEGEVLWRRYPTREDWALEAMTREGDDLVAMLPHQPPAGKLEYSLRLQSKAEEKVLPGADAVVIRFRGDVPAAILVPHILCMFLALALSLRIALGASLGEPRPGRVLPWLLGFLVVGGLILGPMVQKHAFGAYWTGWPFGGDWTDNKTLAAVLAWVAALWVARRWPRSERIACLFGAAVMIGVYLIPHSIHGSELDWEEAQATPSAETATSSSP